MLIGICAIFASHDSKKLGVISLPEEISQAQNGDTMVVVDHGDVLDIWFYHHGQKLKSDESLLVVKF